MAIKISWESNPKDSAAVCYPVFKESAKPADLERFTWNDRIWGRGKLTPIFSREGDTNYLLVGMGQRDQRTSPDEIMERLRQAAGIAGRAAESYEWSSISIDLSGCQWEAEEHQTREAQAVSAWTEGWLLGTYRFDAYLSKKKERAVEELIFQLERSEELVEAAIRGKARAEGTNFARDLGNEPPNHLRPADLIARIKEHFEGVELKTTHFSGQELVQQEMNGIIAVGKGSEHPPALLELRYCTDASLPLIALVGKGITFDTGGISLKSGRDLSNMRLDMCGAAAVAGALDILVKSGAPVNVAVIVATAENRPDGKSMLPGEVITYANGTSVQVGNTDAEGRLVLADALLYAHKIGAKETIDIATLTGACAVSLGERVAGIWGDEPLIETLQTAGRHSGDKTWPMPLEEEYAELLSSHYADISNISKGPYAGAITAALFLKKFIPADMLWAHIDMAGPMEATSTKGYIPAGATGYGARLLSDYVISRTRS